MATFLLRAWTGPCLVGQIAEKARDAGLAVTCEGTEHVYVRADGSDEGAAAWNVLVDLVRKHGTDFGLRPKVLHRVA